MQWDSTAHELKQAVNRAYRHLTLVQRKLGVVREVQNEAAVALGKLQDDTKKLTARLDTLNAIDVDEERLTKLEKRLARLDSLLEQQQQIIENARRERVKLLRQLKQAEASFSAATASYRDHILRLQLRGRLVAALERLIAIKAGVPEEQINWSEGVKVVEGDDGERHIYFGGIGIPDGHWHGHYVVAQDGSVIYARPAIRPYRYAAAIRSKAS